jgi:hypothetical protein
MPSSPFEKSGCYHSQLVTESPITIKITSDSLESKFPKGYGRYINFECYGKKHTYIIENEQCDRALDGLKNQTVTITASGRGDDAMIEVEPQGDQPQAQRTAAAAQRQSAPQSQQQHPSDPVLAFKSKLMRRLAALAIIDSSLSALEQITGLMSPEERQHVRTSLFISMEREGAVDSLSAKTFTDMLPKPAAQQPRQPVREPAPLPQPGANERRAPGQNVDADLAEGDIDSSSVPF